ncbi:hypothetical protein [Streptomyces sp. NPDC005732]|uniref:hypothetical protein n=1 Tax=Streptomyces sp. NPDC005732 TaxID=3157057 RepID=UPI0033ED30F6
MANVRQFDRMIRDAERKLQAVRNREAWPLAAGERAKLASYGTLAFARATRLKESRLAESGMDRIWSAAEERLAAEVRATQAARQQVIDQAAAAKVSKRAESRWW